MKKIGLFLLVVVMTVGAAGMVGCSSDKLETADMAGTYLLAKITVTPPGITLIPPAISGSITLTGAGTFSGTMTTPGGTETVSGTFVVDDPNITFIDTGSTEAEGTKGVITDDGKTITINQAGDEGETLVIVLTKQ